jgi:hypothetical protein
MIEYFLLRVWEGSGFRDIYSRMIQLAAWQKVNDLAYFGPAKARDNALTASTLHSGPDRRSSLKRECVAPPCHLERQS